MNEDYRPLTKEEILELKNEEDSSVLLKSSGLSFFSMFKLDLLGFLFLSFFISFLLVVDGISFYKQFTDEFSIVLLSAILPEVLFTFFTIMKGRTRLESIFHGTIVVICFCMTFGTSVSKHINKGAFTERNTSIINEEINDLKESYNQNKKLIADYHKKGWSGNVKRYTGMNKDIQARLQALRSDLKSNASATNIGGVGLFTIFSVLIRILFSLSNFVINRRIGDIIRAND